MCLFSTCGFCGICGKMEIDFDYSFLIPLHSGVRHNSRTSFHRFHRFHKFHNAFQGKESPVATG